MESVTLGSLLGLVACGSGGPEPSPILTYGEDVTHHTWEVLVYPDAKYSAWSEDPPHESNGTLEASQFQELESLLKPDIACNDATERDSLRTALSLPNEPWCDGFWPEGEPISAESEQLLGLLEDIRTQTMDD